MECMSGGFVALFGGARLRAVLVEEALGSFGQLFGPLDALPEILLRLFDRVEGVISRGSHLTLVNQLGTAAFYEIGDSMQALRCVSPHFVNDGLLVGVGDCLAHTGSVM